MKWTLAILGIIFLSACGKFNTISPESNLASTQSVSSESLYNSMGSYEETVNYYSGGNLYVGAAILEKYQNDTICQKRSPLYSQETSIYMCFKLIIMTNTASQNMHTTITAPEYTLEFLQNGVPMLGQSTFEKINSDQSVLCRRFAAVIPNPVFNYRCYSRQ